MPKVLSDEEAQTLLVFVEAAQGAIELAGYTDDVEKEMADCGIVEPDKALDKAIHALKWNII